jgi:hypothetical protein
MMLLLAVCVVGQSPGATRGPQMLKARAARGDGLHHTSGLLRLIGTGAIFMASSMSHCGSVVRPGGRQDRLISCLFLQTRLA